MKKILLAFLTFFASISTVYGATNLWQFYNDQGQTFPSFDQRKDFYENTIGSDYSGSAEQNNVYLQYLQDGITAITEPKLGAFNPAGGLTYRLQTSAGTTDTTLNLSSFKNRSSIPLTMALLNTDIAYGTISPQTTRSEFISFTGVTQNANGTAQLTGVIRGLSDIYPFTASTTLREAHPGQSIFILSNSPQFQEEYVKNRGAQTIQGLYNFYHLPTSTSTPTGDSQLTTKTYVDSGVLAGGADSSGTVKGLVEQAHGLAAASSTTSGGTSAPQALTTLISSAGCTVATSTVIISKTNGKINKNCIDQDVSYTFSNNVTFNTATTTMAFAAIATTTQFGVYGGLLPVGSITAYTATTAPAGWLIADGSSVKRSKYPQLYAVLHNNYGSVDGEHFNLPNLSGRNILMASTTSAILGRTGGETAHTLTTSEIPSHTHGVTTFLGGSGSPAWASGSTGSETVTSAATGGGLPHNVLDPYIILEYIIKY